MLGFSLTSPDLVICAGSPDLPSNGSRDSTDVFVNKCHQKMETTLELSLDKGIKGSPVIKRNRDQLTVRFSTACPSLIQVLSPESSFELPPPAVAEDKDNSSMPNVMNLENPSHSI